MNEPKTKRRKWKRWVASPMLLVAISIVAGLAILSRGALDDLLRRTIVERISKATGEPAELGAVHFDPYHLRVTLLDLTVHGREPSGTAPLFHTDRLQVDLRVDSWWGRKVSVGDVELLRPSIHVRIERDGRTNLPLPPSRGTSKPLRERLFEVVVRRLRLEDGRMLFNNVAVPLVAEGGRLDLAVDYIDLEGKPAYAGQFQWKQMQFVSWRDLPLISDVSVSFTLGADALSLTQIVLHAAHTSIDAQVSLAGFADPAWTFRYRGQLDLADIRSIMRAPNTPSGQAQFTGDGRFAAHQMTLDGHYSAAGIGWDFQWWHGKGMASRGTYHANQNELDVPDFEATAFGGKLTGHVRMDFHGLKFRVESRAKQFSLASVLAAVNNPDMPVNPLHWNANMEIQSVTTWNGAFQSVDSEGSTTWTPASGMSKGQIPVTATMGYHYNMDSETVAITDADIATPTSRLQVNGTLGATDSGLVATLDAQDIGPWDDFINTLRGPGAEPKVITGKFMWQGRLKGPLVGPTFSGHVHGTNFKYDQLYWDEADGDMVYSPDTFQFTRASARRGKSSAQFDYTMALDDWNFPPESAWNFDATLVRTDMDGLQALFGSSYPVHGIVSGTFHGKGTHAEPEITGLFDVIEPQAWGWRLDRARGELALRHGEVRVSNIELRLLPTPVVSGAPVNGAPGLITGNFLYRTTDGQTVFDLTGAGLPLEAISQIQTPRLPISGRMSFHLNGEGALLAPAVRGSLRLVDLRLGSELAGSYDAKFESDRSQLNVELNSAMSTGEFHGKLGVMLSGDYPVQGHLVVTKIDADALLTSALHLTGLTGHSSVDGEFALSGALLRPKTLAVDANISRVNLDFESIKLENEGPVKFHYGGDEIRIEQAMLRGTDTDFRVSGLARFGGDRSIDMRLDGQVNLRLAEAFVPGLDARGPATIDASVSGTLSDPRLTGRVHVQNASVRYGDFPTGLSQVLGDFIFDTRRLVFDNVTSESGGGRLQIGGTLTYGDGPVRYDLNTRSDQVRIRYPTGMSWLASGTLRLSGSSQAATLSGNITVDRLLISDSVDFSSLAGSSSQDVGSPGSASPFLRNLQFDIQAVTTQGARLEWSSGRFQSEATVRVRGTWDHPILLGNIHLLSGNMNFRGNPYRLTRGDIDFVNPFRLDPTLNIEATTTIQQYEVTIDFTGSASRLTMSYRSDPPLPSSDVVSLLALGQTGEESQLRGSSSAQSPETGATTLLSQAVSSQLGGRLQRLFGISHFSVDPSFASTTTAGSNPAARVTIAQQFSRDLVITYSTDVTSTQQQIIQIEYTVRQDLSIIALRDENGTFGIDVVRRKRFK